MGEGGRRGVGEGEDVGWGGGRDVTFPYLDDIKVRLVVGILDALSSPGDVGQLTGGQNLAYVRLSCIK